MTMPRNPFVWLGAVFALLIVASSTFFTVPEQSQAIVLRLGKPDRIVNAYDEREPFGRTGAGLVAKLPFVENVVFVDKRVRSLDMPAQTVLSTDQLRLVVDAFARYRIVDPLRMYTSSGSEENVSDRIASVLGSRIRNELGRQQFASLLSPERGQLMEKIQTSVNRTARQFGVEIVDVRIKRADLPTGTPLDSAYERMRTARQQEALTIRAQGAKQAQLVRGQADATAARTYAQSFGKDADFYAFYRAMQAYDATFEDGNAAVVLTPDNEFLREFRGGGRGN